MLFTKSSMDELNQDLAISKSSNHTYPMFKAVRGVEGNLWEVCHQLHHMKTVTLNQGSKFDFKC